MKFLRHKINDKRLLGVDNISPLCTWVDASYSSHPNLKSHTGSGMSFWYGLVHCKSIKHKLNTKSSIEAKSVGLSDYLSYNIWVCLFMEAQGFEFKQKILFQDNQSAIRMEKIGKKSCTRNSRHIYIYAIFSWRIGLTVTTRQLPTAAQNTCLQIYLPNIYKERYLWSSVNYSQDGHTYMPYRWDLPKLRSVLEICTRSNPEKRDWF